MFDPNSIDPLDIRFALLRYHLLFDSQRKQAQVHSLISGDEWALLLVTHNQTDPGAPLVIAHGPRALVRRLLEKALRPGKRYLLIMPTELKPMLHAQFHSFEYGVHCLLYSCPLPPPVLPGQRTVRCPGDRGCFSYRVLADGSAVSEARINWRTDSYAEIGVYTKRHYRGQGFAKAALSQLTAEVLATGLRPLYVVSRNNRASIALCEASGYLQSEASEYEAVATYTRGAHRLGDHRRQPLLT